MDPIELLERVARAPVEPLLENLREIHRQRSREPSWLPVLDVLSGFERSRAPGGDSELLPRAVDLLRRIEHETRSGAAAVSRADAGRASYDAIREHFRSHEDELARRASLTERVLDQLRRGAGVDRVPPPAPLQQELRLQCPAGGASAGRFAVANETAVEREVHFEVGSLSRGAPGSGAAPSVSFTPAALRIAPRETRVVRLGLDLARVPLRAGECLEFPVDIRAAEGSLGRLWVEIVIVAPEREDERPGNERG
jgi:hypothetical protein